MKDAGGGVSTLRDSLAAAMVGGELSERHCEILEAAAGLFAERGYAATSVRDIGEKVGLLLADSAALIVSNWESL